MVCTEAIENRGSSEHYFDEARNKEFVPPEAERYVSDKPKLPPIRYPLELIKRQNGTLEVE
mgnify:CR=1 FL=1